MSSQQAMTERGTGLLGTAFGVAMLIAFVGFASNVGLGLWFRTSVDAVASDAARELAASPSGRNSSAERPRVLLRAKQQLGAYGKSVRFTVRETTDAVALRVQSPGIGLLPRVIRGGAIVGSLDRWIIVRRENK